MDQWEIKVRTTASRQSRVITKQLYADGQAEAIAHATMELDDEGEDRWELIHAVKNTS